jgi:hypothetical protein
MALADPFAQSIPIRMPASASPAVPVRKDR